MTSTTSTLLTGNTIASAIGLALVVFISWQSVLTAGDTNRSATPQDQVGSGSMTIAPHGHSATQIPQPLQ